MHDLGHFLVNSNPLRGTVLTLLGSIAIAGGRERFTPYISLGLKTALDVVSSNEVSLVEKEESFIFIGNLLTVIKSDFSEHLSTWIPIFIEFLPVRDFDLQFFNEDADDCEQGLQSSVLKAISSAAKHTGTAFETHFLTIYQAIRAIEPTSETFVRESIFTVYTEMIKFLHSGQPLSILTHVQVDDITRSITNTCLEAMTGDVEEATATAASDALTNFVEHIGEALLKMPCGKRRRNDGETFRAAILSRVVLVLEGKSACQRIMQIDENANAGSDDDADGNDGGGGFGGDDVDIDYGQEDVAEDDEEDDYEVYDVQQGPQGEPLGNEDGDANEKCDCRAILSSVFGLINEVAKAVGPNFIGHFEDLKPLIFGYTDRKHNHVLRAMAVGCLAETTEYIGPIMMQNAGFVDSIVSVLEWSIRDESEMLRRNAAYCLSVVIRYLSSSSLAFHAPRIFKWISPLCHHRIQAGRTNMGGADVDNTLTVLARLVERCDSEEVPRLTSLSMLLEALPLREDFVEGLAIYTILVNLVKGGDAATLMLMPQLLESFVQVLDEKSQYCEDTKTLVSNYLASCRETRS
jgi:hypothetical protein